MPFNEVYIRMELLKEVALKPMRGKRWPGFLEPKRASKVNMWRLDCTPFGKSGMALLAQIYSPNGGVTSSIKTLLEDPNVEQANFTNSDDKSAIGIIFTRNSPTCRAAKAEMVFCKNCMFNAQQDGEGQWDMILEERSLESIIRNLKSNGTSVRIKHLKELQGNGLLTPRQNQVLQLALHEGYFEFPKKHGIKGLAEQLEISTPAISEIIRRGEKKMVQAYYSGRMSYK